MTLSMRKTKEFKVEVFDHEGEAIVMVSPGGKSTFMLTGKRATELIDIIQDITDVVSNQYNKKES